MTSTPRLNYFLISIVIVSAITLVVFAAITANSLEELIGGIVKLGLVVIILAGIAVILFERYAHAKNDLNKENHRHAETMAGNGVLVAGYGFPAYALLQQPEISDMPVSTSGVTQSTIAPYQEDAFELLALTVSESSARDKTQIMPYHKARKNAYFKDPAVWMRAVQFLLVNQIAKEEYDGKRKLGTFVISGTVGQAYDRMKQQSPNPLLR